MNTNPSLECQTSEATYEGIYSPQACDIWSLGIVLLNIVTGRNPWKSANMEDPTFRSYQRNPFYFLPKILPISAELNDILAMMLNVEWQARPSIPEIRAAVSEISTFYSTDVIFEGNVARCAWETGMDLGTGTYNQSSRGGTASEQPPSAAIDVLSTSSLFEHNTLFDKLSETEEDSREPEFVSYLSRSAPVSRSSSSLCTSDPSSPITPVHAGSSIDRRVLSRPRSPFTSFINGLQCFFRLCSSQSASPHLDKDRFASESEMFTIDL